MYIRVRWRSKKTCRRYGTDWWRCNVVLTCVIYCYVCMYCCNVRCVGTVGRTDVLEFYEMNLAPFSLRTLLELKQ